MAEPSETRDQGDPRSSPGIRRALLVTAGLLAFLLAAGSALAIAGILYFDSQLTKLCTGPGCRGKDALVSVDPHQQCDDTPCNFLILGSDSRKGLSKKEQKAIGTGPDDVKGHRADTIIVVNVNPATDRTVVLHIPRDLLVTIPGHGEARINSAFGFGEDVMVRTVEKLTGLAINHYVEVNFEGFEKLVNALGGVTICVDRPMVDDLAGLKLRHAGCYDMNGRRALAFVRARHVEGDNIPDFSRISRQQQFMRAVIDKLLAPESILGDVRGLIRTAEANLRVDDGLNLYELQDLTRRLAGLGQGGVLFRVVPAVPMTIDGADYVVTTPQAERLFERIQKGRSPGTLGKEQAFTNLSPAAISVRVYDAGGGVALQQAIDYLQQAGFEVLPVEPAPAGLDKSSIVYRRGTSNERRVVASYLPDWPTERNADQVQAAGADVVVVVAADSPGVPR